MHTLRRKDIIFILLFLLLYIVYYFFLLYVDKQEKFNELSNRFYTTHHQVLVDHGAIKWVNTPFSPSGYRLFLEYNDTYRFFIDHHSEWSPPMESGRFFGAEETKPVAVVGREMADTIRESNGIKQISFHGQKYEVVGMIGAPFASPIDYLILLYQPNDIPTLPDMRIIIDSERKSTVTEITENVIAQKPAVTRIESSHKGLARTANLPFLYRLLLFEFYLLLLLSTLAFIRFWYESEQKKLHILYILGISTFTISISMFRKILVFITVPGAILYLVISMFGSGLFLNQILWIMFLFLMSACAVTSLLIKSTSSTGGAISK